MSHELAATTVDATSVDPQISDFVRSARQGDSAAFEELVKHYYPRIYDYVARMVRDPVEAEDVAQEAFVRAYQALPHFRGDASFQTWLYRIASNLAIDASRHHKRRQWQTASLDEPLERGDSQLARDPVDDQSRTPAEQVEALAIREQVWRAISELSDKLRPVVILHDLQGLSYDEIAGTLGCPLGTVKSRLFNARCQLRDKLKRRLPAEVFSDWGLDEAAA
jgi:RNA polymerase sigma-70 factor (ECF subfamily)